jgi:hypothetical protein
MSDVRESTGTHVYATLPAMFVWWFSNLQPGLLGGLSRNASLRY